MLLFVCIFSLNKHVTQLLNLLARAFIVLTIETTSFKASIKTENTICAHLCTT